LHTVVAVAVAVAIHVADMQHTTATTTATATATTIQYAVSRTVVVFGIQLLGTFLIIDNCPGHRFGILPVCLSVHPSVCLSAAAAAVVFDPAGVPAVGSNALKCFFVKTSYTLQFALNPTWLWPGISPLGRCCIL